MIETVTHDEEPIIIPKVNNSAIVDVSVVPAGKEKKDHLTNRQSMLCKFISEGCTNSKAYALAYNVKYEGNEQRCQSRVSLMLNRHAKLRWEIERLQKIRTQQIIKNAPDQIAKLFPKALDTYDDLMTNSKKDSARLGAANAIKDTVIPKQSRHMTVKVNVPADEYKRRIKLLDG